MTTKEKTLLNEVTRLNSIMLEAADTLDASSCKYARHVANLLDENSTVNYARTLTQLKEAQEVVRDCGL